jgi:hypothetical protein
MLSSGPVCPQPDIRVLGAEVPRESSEHATLKICKQLVSRDYVNGLMIDMHIC